MAAEIFVYEFLYRGQPAANIANAAWHVTLGASDTDGFGKPSLTLNGPLSIAQAESASFPLPTLLGMINDASLKQIEVLNASVADLQTQVSAVTDQLNTATSQNEALASQLADATAQIAAFEAAQQKQTQQGP